MSLHVNSCRFIFYSFFQLSTVNLYLFDDLVCNHITSKIVFLHTLITPPGSQRNYTAASAIHMFPLGVCAMQMLQPWKIEQNRLNQPPTHTPMALIHMLSKAIWRTERMLMRAENNLAYPDPSTDVLCCC